jgi:hypothetical protein
MNTDELVGGTQGLTWRRGASPDFGGVPDVKAPGSGGVFDQGNERLVAEFEGACPAGVLCFERADFVQLRHRPDTQNVSDYSDRWPQHQGEVQLAPWFVVFLRDGDLFGVGLFHEGKVGSWRRNAKSFNHG